MAIKLLIFDFDGVIVNTANIHLAALNKALSEIDEKFIISNEENNSIYGSKTSKDKLKLLTLFKGLPIEHYKYIFDLKKKYSKEILQSLPISEYFSESTKLIINKLHKEGFLIHLASNTNREFVNDILDKVQIDFDHILTNNDIINPKPNSEIYLRSIIAGGAEPHETIIFEDSIEGQEAAINSGAHLFPVEKAGELDYNYIKDFIFSIKPKRIKYKSNKLNILIPCAGFGSRFKEKGFLLPKPLINVNGIPMVAHVINDLNVDANYIFIIKKEHEEQYNLTNMLKLMVQDCQVILVDGKQNGAATTCLAAEHLINNQKHLMIANSDNGWDWQANQFYHSAIQNGHDGCITIFNEPSKDPRWSFARVDSNGKILEIAEKNPISTLATSGSYFFNKGSDFVKYTKQMVEQKLTVLGEYYVAPIYNLMIKDGKYIDTFAIEKFWGMGTPEELEYYLTNRSLDV